MLFGRVTSLFFAVTLLGLLPPLACRNSPVEVRLGSLSTRFYKWNLDTLQVPGVPQVFAESVWGTRYSNVYVAGFSSVGGRGKLFHFDGLRWAEIRFPFGHVNPTAITGFGPHDVWVVGYRSTTNPNPPPNFLDSAFVVHYDGSQWREVEAPKVAGLMSVCATRTSGLLIGTRDGRILRYDRSNWLIDSVYDGVAILSVLEANGVMFAGGLSIHGAEYELDSAFSFINYGTEWTVLERDHRFSIIGYRRFPVAALTVSPEGDVFGVAFDAFRWEFGSWRGMNLVQDDFVGIHARSSNDILVVSSGFHVLHWDGRTWVRPTGLPPRESSLFNPTEVWMGEDCAFIVGHNGSISFVLRGE